MLPHSVQQADNSIRCIAVLLDSLVCLGRTIRTTLGSNCVPLSESWPTSDIDATTQRAASCATAATKAASGSVHPLNVAKVQSDYV